MLWSRTIGRPRMQTAIDVQLLTHTPDPVRVMYVAFRTCYSRFTPPGDLGRHRVGQDHPGEDEGLHLRQVEERPFLAAHAGLFHVRGERSVAGRQPPAR